MKREASKWGRMLSVLLFVGLTSGCGAQRALYRPSNAKTFARGYRAAFYRIVVDKYDMGTAKVFSEGGLKKPTDGGQSVIDVRLRVWNKSNAPITLDLAKTGLVVDTDDQSFVLKRPVGTMEVVPISPGSVAYMVLDYALAANLAPTDVSTFEFSWGLKTSKGIYTQTTPFVRVKYMDAYSYYPAWYYEYPYIGPWYPYDWYWDYDGDFVD